jgi:hypothetical protein
MVFATNIVTIVELPSVITISVIWHHHGIKPEIETTL